MSAEHPESFQILAELYRTEFFTTWHARHLPTERDVRFTRFEKSVSECANFRAAFRKDEPSLRSFHHANVLQFLDWGEDNGQLFYTTELPSGESLADRLAHNQTFSWDEFTDIGWQIASALQHSHNVGITHGRLTTQSIVVTDELRVKVAGFGLYRWIAAWTSNENANDAAANAAHQDLVDFGELLDVVLKCVIPETKSAADHGHVTDMRKLITELRDPPLDFTARDVQGRLGNMLLRSAGESIEMIDHRKGQGRSRRSIVDELFDDVDENRAPVVSPPVSGHPNSGHRDWRIVFLLAAVLALLTLLRLLCR